MEPRWISRCCYRYIYFMYLLLVPQYRWYSGVDTRLCKNSSYLHLNCSYLHLNINNLVAWSTNTWHLFICRNIWLFVLVLKFNIQHQKINGDVTEDTVSNLRNIMCISTWIPRISTWIKLVSPQVTFWDENYSVTVACSVRMLGKLYFVYFPELQVFGLFWSILSPFSV